MIDMVRETARFLELGRTVFGEAEVDFEALLLPEGICCEVMSPSFRRGRAVGIGADAAEALGNAIAAALWWELAYPNHVRCSACQGSGFLEEVSLCAQCGGVGEHRPRAEEGAA